MYAAVIPAALQYAASLRALYDTQRGKVLAALGLQVPAATTHDEERTLWRKVTEWLEYGLLPASETYAIRSDGGVIPAASSSGTTSDKSQGASAGTAK